MAANWRISLEYRTNFIFEGFLSLIEVGMYLFYWKMFFAISGGVQGATFAQIAALIAFNHVIYAGADTLMGNNVWETVDLIVSGQLDVFLAQPKSPVFQLFFSGAQPLRAIQIVVGTILYFWFIPLTVYHAGMYLFGFAIGTVIFTSWVIAIHSLTFRLGNSTVIYKLLSIILHFAKKPANIFSFAVRMVLYTVIPAAYLGTVQAEQLIAPDPRWIVGLIAIAVISPIIAVTIFRRGLRLYESGNLIGARI